MSGGVYDERLAPVGDIDWEKMQGLVPAVIQHAHSREVLMLGYMNADALNKTLQSRKVTFFSRQKQRLWQKGETSGHTLTLVDIFLDCDSDALLVLALPHGPTCHLNTNSCFAAAPQNPMGFLNTLNALIRDRAEDDATISYTARLLQGELRRVAQKVGEEGVETALAAVVQSDDEFIDEAADLVYHLVVLCRAKGFDLDAIVQRLERRHEG